MQFKFYSYWFELGIVMFLVLALCNKLHPTLVQNGLYAVQFQFKHVSCCMTSVTLLVQVNAYLLMCQMQIVNKLLA